MAGPTDPTTPTTPAQVVTPTQADLDLWNQYTQQTNDASIALAGFSSGGELVQKTLNLVDDVANKAGVSLEHLGSMTDRQATKFGVVSAAALGAQKSFAQFANVDTGRLNTFNDQLDALLNNLKNSPGISTSRKALEEWGQVMKKNGLQSDLVDRAVRDLGNGITSTARAMLEGADNNLRLQNAFIQLTAQMGDSNTLFGQISNSIAGVGDDLHNLNNVTLEYRDIMTRAMLDTNTKSIDQMAEWASAINKLPGGLKELMGSMTVGGDRTNLLTSAIKFATGSGRQFSEVVQDMKQAMLEYGISGEQALKFTTNITQVANNFHAQVEDVRGALMQSVDAFKFFAIGEDGVRKTTDGLSESMNQYVGSLRSVGVPVQNALEMYKNYTNVVKGMTQAQESFISAQTGGPGGLRGGFQIDQLIRSGNFQELQRKVEQTIRRMTGPIVSLDEAQRSESAAAQYTRQIQILQQGPLGRMAQTRGEAEALLEAMRSGKMVTPLKKPTEELKDEVAKGTKIEQLTYTDIHQINANIERMRAVGESANLTTMQRAFAARTGAGGGAGGTGRGLNVEGQQDLRKAMAGVQTESATRSEAAMRHMGKTVSELPAHTARAMHSLKESLTRGSNAQQDMADHLNAMRTQQHYTSLDEFNLTARRAATKGAGGPTGLAAGTTAPTATGTMNQQPVPVVLAHGSAINVNFNGVCPHCGRDVHTTEVGRTVAPQALTGPGF